jgi:hypothetical protein
MLTWFIKVLIVGGQRNVVYAARDPLISHQLGKRERSIGEEGLINWGRRRDPLGKTERSIGEDGEIHWGRGTDQLGDPKVVTGLIHWGRGTDLLGDKEKLMGGGLSYWDKLQRKKKKGTEECTVG